MKTKKIKLMIAGLLVCFSCSVQGSEKLRIYLPREAQIDNEKITLGRVCVLSGEQALINTANDIVLGQIYDRGRVIIVSRAMILGRLSANGIEGSKIEFSGAEEIKVIAQYSVISGSRFVEIAQEFITNSIPKDNQFRFNLVKTPKDLVIPGRTGDVQLTCQLIEEQSNDKICVEVAVLSQGKEVDSRQVHFQKLLQVKSEPTSNKSLPKQAKAEILVKRNKPVAVVISRPGIFITSTGRALEDGRAGEFIKIQMQITDSSRTIVAKVKNDGTVEPLL